MNAERLDLEGVDAWYGRAQVLFGVTFSLAPGEVAALVGRNGAGKSTTMRAVMGLMPRAAGRIRFSGADLLGLPAHAIARLGIGWVPEDRRVFADLTVRENLEAGRKAGPGPAFDEGAAFRLFPQLEALAGRQAGTLSGGEQQMLTLARTLMGRPALLLLDEPSEGLAPRVVAAMAEAVGALKRTGLAILLSEQNLRFAGRVADRAVVLEHGTVRFDGPMTGLLGDPDRRARWLAA